MVKPFLRFLRSFFSKPRNGFVGTDMTSDMPLRYIDGTFERIQATEAAIRDGGC